jgi:hypothetical protein
MDRISKSRASRQVCSQYIKRTKKRPMKKYIRRHRIVIIGDSHIRACSEELANNLGNDYSVIGIRKPNANESAIISSMNLKEDKLTKNYVIICGGSRDIGKNKSTHGIRSLMKFANCLVNTNMIIMTAPHRFDLLSSSYLNKEVKTLKQKAAKEDVDLLSHISMWYIYQ